MDNIGGNTKFKLEYMNLIAEKYSKSTQRNVSLLLRNAKFYEDMYKKDVYEFGRSEMIDMLKSFRIKTKNSLKHSISVYGKYIERAIEEGLVSSNVMDMITFEDYDNIVDIRATEDRYITRKELFENIEFLANAQDQIVFALLFDGVMGKNYENLTNLKVKDINPITLEAKLFDGTEVQISDDTYNLIQIAIEETTYDTYSKTEMVYPLEKNEYVLRVPKRPAGTSQEPVRANSVRTKIDQFKKELGIEGLTGRSIYLSGVAERAINDNMNNASASQLSDWLLTNEIKTNANEMANIIKMIENKS